MDVPFDVVHGDQGLVDGVGESLGVADSNQQGARQAWPRGYRDCIQIAERAAGLFQRGAHYGHDVAKVLAGGEFWNDSAIGRVQRDLRGHDARARARAALHHRGGGFVAGTLNGKYEAASGRIADSAPGVQNPSPFYSSGEVAMAASNGGRRAREEAFGVVARLRSQGYQAYYAGGCVRDLLLGHEPADFDVATDARPEVVLNLFPRTFSVGAHFGVVLVAAEEAGREIVTEVATFRSDGAYSDGRRPDQVSYSASPEEDVLRRDFTINGMMLDPHPVGGERRHLECRARLRGRQTGP